MNVILFTRFTTYTGNIPIPLRGETGDGVGESYRLQDVLNNPLILYKTSEIRTRNILLQTVIATVETMSGVEDTFNADQLFIDPDQIEIVYDASQKSYTPKGVELERQLNQPNPTRVEIITRSRKRITGVLHIGLRALTNPDPKKSFFAVSNASVELLYSGKVHDHLHYVLLNYNFVEAFRELKGKIGES